MEIGSSIYSRKTDDFWLGFSLKYTIKLTRKFLLMGIFVTSLSSGCRAAAQFDLSRTLTLVRPRLLTRPYQAKGVTPIHQTHLHNRRWLYISRKVLFYSLNLRFSHILMHGIFYSGPTKFVKHPAN